MVVGVAPDTQWWPSPFGADDQLGMLNHIDAATRLAALQLVRQGAVHDLGRHRPHCFFEAKGHGIDAGIVPDGSSVDVARPGFRFICKPGAVGTPNGEDRRACYTILDTETMCLTYHRLDWRSESSTTPGRLDNAGGLRTS
jgi:hypothetical protein